MTDSLAELEDDDLLDQVIQPVATLMAEPAGDELVIVNTTDEGTYYLNPPARLIWEMIDGTRRGSDILAALQAAYDSGPTADHVASTLRGFAGGGLIERA
ncbi:PqqD family protein [Spiribacter roseus]|uniref:PqqD family protein n=1 Tax=Spiribacter roseus TaxID=1855875 RepID=UPI001330686A|nr:PqqD family protein [Spiribacter roseus]KAF0283193.1 hypothetical protein BA898_05020 [Spiribacter roseus]